MTTIKEKIQNLFNMTDSKNTEVRACSGSCNTCGMNCPYGAGLWLPKSAE